MGFITNRTLARRTFLRGLGTTLALPFLESMLPAAVRRAREADFAHALRRRLRAARRRAGLLDSRDDARRASSIPFIYEPLEPFRKHVVLTSGLWSKSSENPPGVTGADHFVAAAYLSGMKPRKTTGADIEAGTTLDQVIAQQIGKDDAAAIAAARPRRPGRELHQLRRGLQLRLHEHDLLADADAAAADGDQPAGGVRAHVRRRQLARAAHGAARAPGAAFSTP